MTLRYAWLRLWRGVVRSGLHRPARESRVLVEELRAEIEAVAALPSRGLTDTDREWLAHRARLRHLVLTADPRRFLTWDVVKTTMVTGDTSYVVAELEHLRSRPDWWSRWRPALRESEVGHPRLSGLHRGSSGTLIHHAYHVSRFEESTGVRIDRAALVVEFGGGYGSLARLVHALGFAGTYVLVDLPEVGALQRFFLKSLGVPVASGVRDAGRGAVTVSRTDELSEVVRAHRSAGRVFVATWSLSEAPVPLRLATLGEVAGFDAYLIAYQARFGQVDNVRFFSDWRTGLDSAIAWDERPIPHLGKASFYLFGVAGRPPSALTPPA